ncbi:MAG: hypothetical protein KDE45_09505 [Caldilineaceae bacterium]|nr:hypothetical protein [Caldilineaceae bacterium]
MGATEILATGPTPRLTLDSIEGNLVLNGWDRPEVQLRVRGDGDSLSVDSSGDSVAIHCEDDLWVQAPLQASITIHSVAGNASLSMILNSVTIGTIEGNTVVNSVNAVTAGRIEGNLAARLIAGDLTVDTVEGNAQVAKVAGDVQLGRVEGNVSLDEIGGSTHATAEGNVKAKAALAPGQECTIEAEGNIVCEIPREAGAAVTLKADGPIRVKEFGDERSTRSGNLAFVQGSAEARLNLAAEGSIVVRGIRPWGMDGSDFAAGFDEEMALRSVEITQQITEQIESQVNELSRQLDDKLSRLGNNEELAVNIQERVQSAMRRAEEKLAEAMRKVEQRVQEAERRSGEGDGRRRKSYGWASPPPAPPAPPKPKRAPATDEERMMILRMVEQGKISIEQAEKLLAALSGGKAER